MRKVLPALGLATVLVGCGDDDSSFVTTTTSSPQSTVTETTITDTSGLPTETTQDEFTLIEITVVDGQVEGGLDRIEVPLGGRIVLRVHADATDHVHVHTYDLLADVAPGSPAEIEFVADIPGGFEVELEGSGLELVRIQVS